MPRFVVLLHEMPDEVELNSHWDWMFDTGTMLETWRTPIGHSIYRSFEISLPCERLADHRRDYLEYQGPIPGNRGSVSQVFCGRYEPLAERTTAANSTTRLLYFDGLNIEDFPSRWRWEIVGTQGNGRESILRCFRESC